MSKSCRKVEAWPSGHLLTHNAAVTKNSPRSLGMILWDVKDCTKNILQEKVPLHHPSHKLVKDLRRDNRASYGGGRPYIHHSTGGTVTV